MSALRPLGDFDHIVIDPMMVIDQETLHNDIISHIVTIYRSFKQDRQSMEKLWLNAWASYLGTYEAKNYIDRQSIREIGSVKTNWRHRTQVGKAFETVETLHAYFMQAFFPNEVWFDIDYKSVQHLELARVTRQFLSDRFDDWNFIEEWSAYLRQLIICGTSVLALPWSSDDDKVEYETLDLFETYFNPRARRIEDSPFIRKVIKTRADLIEGINSGKYNKEIKPLDIVRLTPNDNFGEIEYDENTKKYQEFRGIQCREFSFSDKVTTLEYWGDVHLPYLTIKNCLIHITGSNILRFQPNTYKCGKPFIVGSYIPVVRQAYGLSALQSSLGMITQINNSVNQMLDGIELAVNPMYTYIQDQTIDPENMETEPGKLIPVESHDAVRPVQPPLNNFNLSFQQIQFLEQMVNQNAGLGPLLGVGQPRGGERVTAAEIQAVLEAGGNRQLGVYSHIQLNSFVPCLRKTVINVRQYTNIDRVVKVEDPLNQVVMEYDFGRYELAPEFELIPRGSEHVVQKEEKAARRSQVLQLALSLPPEVQQQIDLVQLFLDIIRQTLYEDPERYLLPQPVMEEPTMEEQGSPLQQAVIEDQIQADGGASLFQKLYGQELPQQLTPGIEENGQPITQ